MIIIQGRPLPKGATKTKASTHPFPVVSHVGVDERLTKWYSSNETRGHGETKLVFSILSKYIFLDLTGEFGVTDACYFSPGKPDELKQIKKAMLTPRFQDLSRAMVIQGLRGTTYNFLFLRQIEPDFYKEFL